MQPDSLHYDFFQLSIMSTTNQPRRESVKPSASLDSTPAPSISPDDSYPGARAGAVAMGRHFVVWIRPNRSGMAWQLAGDGKGKARVFRVAREADDEAVALTDAGWCAVVSAVALPVEPSDRLMASLSTGAMWLALDH